MPFTDDERAMLREAATRLVKQAGRLGDIAPRAAAATAPSAVEAARHTVAPTRDMDEATWRNAVESGWPALLVPEAAGGLGAGASELCILAEELGAGLQLGDFLLGSVLPAQWLAALPRGARRDALLETLLAGSRTLAIADLEPGHRGVDEPVRLLARHGSSGWILEGRKHGVWSASSTRTLLVTTTTESGDAALQLFEIPLDAGTGLRSQRRASIDAGQVLELNFDDLAPRADALIGGGPGFVAARRRGWDLVLLGHAAECIGVMRALMHRTSEYLTTREQFGQPLSKFQVLRHRLADMALARLRADALVARAGAVFEQLSDGERRRFVAACAVKALTGARYVAEQAVQLHGGMGVSEELPLGRYLRRVMALEATLGTPAFHAARFAANAGPR